jgi:methylglutamate dehydrogenase subunit B
MRIQGPFCGERDSSEFVYHGDANSVRPDPDAADAPARFFDAIYMRENPAGPHLELWYHGFGCRSWLRVQRNTRTHEILAVTLAKSHVGAATADS